MHQKLTTEQQLCPPHSTETQQGFLDLILKEAFSPAGYSAEIRMLPAERCLHDSNSGHTDGEIRQIRSLSRFDPNLMIVDEPLIENRKRDILNLSLLLSLIFILIFKS